MAEREARRERSILDPRTWMLARARQGAAQAAEARAAEHAAEIDRLERRVQRLRQRSNGGWRNPRTGAGDAALDNAQHGLFELSSYGSDQLVAAYNESWFAAAVVDYIVKDMTGRWREWLDDDGAMEEAERRHDVRDRVSQVLRLSRLLGTGLLVMFSREAPLEEELVVEQVRPGDLLNLFVTSSDRVASMTVVDDPADPRYGEALDYRVIMGNSLYTVHGSRVLRFDHGGVPGDRSGYNWGRSALDPAMRAAANDALISQSIGHLSQESSMLTMKIKQLHEKVASHGFNDSEDASPSVAETVEEMRANKSIYRMNVVDADDDVERTEVRWNGFDRIQEVVFKRQAAIAGIPATRLMGQSPVGMNATGESDLLNYAMAVAALQAEQLTAPLEPLDAMLAADAGLAEAPGYRWLPLTDLSDKDRADIAQTWATALSAARAAGFIDEDESREIMRETGVFGELEGEAPGYEPLTDFGGQGEAQGEALGAADADAADG